MVKRLGQIALMVALFAGFAFLVSETRRTAYNKGVVTGCNSIVMIAPLMRMVSFGCSLEHKEVMLNFRDKSQLNLKELYN